MSSSKEHGFLLEPSATTTLPKEDVCSSVDATTISEGNHSQYAKKSLFLPSDVNSNSDNVMSDSADTIPETGVKQRNMDAEPQMLFSVTQDKSAKLICSFSQPTVSVKEEIPATLDDSLSDENGQNQAKEADYNATSSPLSTETGNSHPSYAMQETVVKQEVITDHPEPETEEPPPSYCCKYCGQKLKTPRSLLKHEEGHRNGTIYKCRFCNYHTLSRPFMEGHESQHTGIKPFKCDYCEHRTRYSVDMQKHQRVHFSTRKFKCHLCPFQSKWKGGMDKHLLTHTNIRNFSCHLCSARFKRKSGLKTHMTIHSSDKPYKCDQCSYSCRIMSMLRMHAKSHSDVRNFACSYPGCTQKCKTRSDLTKHFSVHLETCDFECNLCGKKFKSRHSLNSHIHRHDEKEMDFICNFCNKKLGTRFGLRKHLTQHFSEKKHCCSVCGHKFYNRSNMIKHMMVHDGSDKDFCCPICKFFGKDVSILLTHIGQMHGKDYTYFCEECRKPFSTVLRMRQHVRRCHYEKIPGGRDDFVYNQYCCVELSPLERTQNRLEGVMGYETGNSTNLRPGIPALHSDPNLESSSQGLLSRCNEMVNISKNKVDNIASGEIVNNCNDPGNSLTLDKVPTASNNETWSSLPNADPKEEAGFDLNVPSTPTMKSLFIKLERLSDGTTGEGNLAVDGSRNAAPAPPKVVKLGSIGDIGICLASKDSGVRLNLEKRGKKTNKWFMDMEHMPSNYAGRRKRYFNREWLSNTSKKERKSPGGKRCDGKGKKKIAPELVKEVQKKSIESSSKLSSPAKRSPLKKRISVRDPTVSTDDKQSGEVDPLPVNFDVRVKCKRLTTDQVKRAIRGIKRASNLPLLSLESSNVGALMSKELLSSSGNKDVTIKCERLDPNEMDIGTTNSTSANSLNHKILGSDCLGDKWKLSLPESSCHRGATRKKTKASLSTFDQSPRKRPNKKTSKQSTKGFEKAKADMAFVEESSVVEDILGSPFQITWKTLRKVEENGLSQKRSCLTKELPENATISDGNCTINSVYESDVDQKPSWLTTGSHLDISLNLLKNSASSRCSVQVEDISHVIQKTHSQDNQNEIFHKKDMDKHGDSLIEHKKRNEAHPPIHTITLDEFEEEYKRKKKLIAKVNIVTQPSASLDKQQSNYRHGIIRRQSAEANREETKENVTLKDILKKPQNFIRQLGHNIEIDVPEETGLEMPKNPVESGNTSKLSPAFPKGRGKSVVKQDLGDSQQESSGILKVKKKKLKKEKKKITTIALFRDNFPELRKRATSNISNTRRKKAKETISPKLNLIPNNSPSSRNVGIVKLWKMAFECLTTEVSVKLFDFKNFKPVPFSHEKESYDKTTPSIIEQPYGHVADAKIVQSFNEQSLVMDESENANALCKIPSSSTDYDIGKMASSLTSIKRCRSLEDVDVEDNQPKKSACDSIINVIDRQHVGIPIPSSEHARSHESEYLNGQSPICPKTKPAESSVGNNILGIDHEGESQEEPSLVCSHKSAFVHHEEENQQQQPQVSPIHPENESKDEVLPVHSMIELQRDVTVNPVVELKPEFSDAIKLESESLGESSRQRKESRSPNQVPLSTTDDDHRNRSTMECYLDETSHLCSTAFQGQNAPEEPVTMGVSNTGNEGNAESQNTHQQVSKTSHLDMPTSLDTPVSDRKCRPKESIADFLQGHEKSLQKLFASCQIKFTSQGLRKYINKWKQLPLPRDFLMNENGLISKTKTDSVELIESGSVSTFIDCSASESGHINSEMSPLSQIGKSKEPHEFGSEKIKKKGRKRFSNISFGQSERRGGKSQKVVSVGGSSEPHSTDSTDGNESKSQTYIKTWTVFAEVHEHIDYDPFNVVANEKSDDLVISRDHNIGSHEISHHSKKAAKLKGQYKTSNPMLCLPEDEAFDVLDNHSTPRVSDSDQTPSCSAELPSKVHDSSYPLSTFPEVFFDNDSDFSCGLQGTTSQNGNLLLESGVLPPSDDICPLPEDFFNDSL